MTRHMHIMLLIAVPAVSLGLLINLLPYAINLLPHAVSFDAQYIGKPVLTKTLVTLGTPIKQTSVNNQTLLHTLSNAADSPEVAEYLISQGLDPHATDSAGKKAHDYALQNGHTNLATYLQNQ